MNTKSPESDTAVQRPPGKTIGQFLRSLVFLAVVIVVLAIVMKAAPY